MVGTTGPALNPRSAPKGESEFFSFLAFLVDKDLAAQTARELKALRQQANDAVADAETRRLAANAAEAKLTAERESFSEEERKALEELARQREALEQSRTALKDDQATFARERAEAEGAFAKRENELREQGQSLAERQTALAAHEEDLVRREGTVAKTNAAASDAKAEYQKKLDQLRAAVTL